MDVLTGLTLGTCSEAIFSEPEPSADALTEARIVDVRDSLPVAEEYQGLGVHIVRPLVHGPHLADPALAPDEQYVIP